MSLFNEEIAPFFVRLDDSCVYHPKGMAYLIKENKKDGEAELNLISQYNSFHVHGDNNNLPVLRNKKNADYLVFLHDDETNKWHLHIFEFTRSVNNTKWTEKIVQQFDGALLNAYAIGGVLRVPEFEKVTLHCGYRRDKNLANLAELKAQLGKATNVPWTFGTTVELPSFPGKRYVKNLIKLDPENGKGKDMELT